MRLPKQRTDATSLVAILLRGNRAVVFVKRSDAHAGGIATRTAPTPTLDLQSSSAGFKDTGGTYFWCRSSHWLRFKQYCNLRVLSPTGAPACVMTVK